MAACENCGHTSTSSSYSGRHPTTSERRAALARVKAQIELHKKFIAAFEREQEELENSLSQVIYPVLSLPFDVTSCIFLHCLPSHGQVSPSPSTAPLVLAQICRRWREVALSTCGLWSSLYLNPGIDMGTVMYNPTVAPDDRFRNLLRTWFSRARGSPLSLGLDFRFRKASNAFMNLVSSYAGQIYRLDLHIWPEQFQKSRPLRASFPLLQHFSTSHSSEKDVHALLNHGPPLRVLRLIGNESDRDFSVNFSLPVLTSLEIAAEISAETFLGVLRGFPALSDFHFCLLESDSSKITEPSIPTTFPLISSLTLGSGQSCAALCLVTFPNLHFLKLPDFCALDEVQKLLSRSACTIDHLVISFQGCDEYSDDETDETAEWLRLFPAVSILEVTECLNVSALIDSLNLPSLVPRLRDVTICSSYVAPANIDNDYDEYLVEMLHRRRDLERSQRLRRFHLKFSTVAAGKDDAWFPGYLAKSALEKLIADGLDFALRLDCFGLGRYSWPPTLAAEDLGPQFP
ncbi:F-box domain-containing protein [Mycena venus]|uniref:F-box domain-containing protein n=1 Tax=Mycena venus TaxID=2733690 RepID=A0A8H7CKQ8_9AGAR|nr:F-box domain-containing protein [Mycena venus]